MLGEIPLLDGGRHSASRVTEAASLLSLSRADFAALVSRRHPTAFALKRRIAHVACARLRQLANLARSLGGGPSEERPPGLEFCAPPNSGTCSDSRASGLDSLALWGFLTAGRCARARRTARLSRKEPPRPRAT